MNGPWRMGKLYPQWFVIKNILDIQKSQNNFGVSTYPWCFCLFLCLSTLFFLLHFKVLDTPEYLARISLTRVQYFWCLFLLSSYITSNVSKMYLSYLFIPPYFSVWLYYSFKIHFGWVVSVFVQLLGFSPKLFDCNFFFLSLWVCETTEKCQNKDCIKKR